MKNILIPIDGSVYSDKAVEKGREIGEAFDSNVVLLNIMPPFTANATYGYAVLPLDMIKEEYEISRKNSEAVLASAKKSFAAMGTKVSTVSLHGDTADAIIDYIKSNSFDLVVMGSHGLGAILNRLLTGSVTTKVLHHIQIPILIVK